MEKGRQLHHNICDPCLTEHHEIPAAIFCVDCMEYLCEECHRVHKKIRSSRDHKTCDQDKVSYVKYVHDIVRCQAHENEDINFLCQKHDELCCKLCVSTKHKQCIGFVNLKDQVGKTDIEMSTTEQKVSAMIFSLTKKANIFKEEISNAKTDIHEQEAQVDQLLKDFKAEIIEVANQLEKTIKENVANEKGVAMKRVQSLRNAETSFKQYVEKCNANLDAIKEFGGPLQMFLFEQLLRRESDQETELLEKTNTQLTAQARLTDIAQQKIDTVREMIKICFQNLEMSTGSDYVEDTDPDNLDVKRQRKIYSRASLFKLQNAPLALQKPYGLPNIPDILLDKTDEDEESSNNYTGVNSKARSKQLSTKPPVTYAGTKQKAPLLAKTEDDIVFETFYHRSGKEFQCFYQSGMRFYLHDLVSKEWLPFPRRWYNEGLLVTNTV